MGSEMCIRDRGNTGGFGSTDCAVDIAFGKMESSGGYSRLQVMTNALSGSSVRVHSCNEMFGCNWNDAQKFEWSPNHRPSFREMQFSIEVRDAFGRDDIEEVNLIMATPNGANAVFEKNFDDDDLKLDNNGLVGNTRSRTRRTSLQVSTPYGWRLKTSRVTPLSSSTPASPCSRTTFTFPCPPTNQKWCSSHRVLS